MRRRRGIAIAASALAGLLLLGALAVGALYALLHTEGGLRAAVTLVERVAPGTVTVQGVSGTLDSEFGAEHLRVVAGRTTVELTGLRARLREASLGERLRAWTGSPPRLDFESLRATTMTVEVRVDDTPGAPAPASIGSPVAARAERLTVGELQLRVGTGTLALRAIEARSEIGPQGYRVAEGHFVAAGMPVAVDGRLGGERPFAVEAHGSVRGTLAEHPLQADWRAGGDLTSLLLTAQLGAGAPPGSDAARGTVRARLAPLGSEPVLKSLDVDLAGIDPRAWIAGLPTARLGLRATLTPAAGARALAGPVALVNEAPGPIDAGRLPVRAAGATVSLTPDALRAEALQATLTRGAVRGKAVYAWGQSPTWDATLKFAGVDPAALHRAARPLVLDGEATLRHEAAVTGLRAALRQRGQPAVDARLDLRLDAQELKVDAADLALGEGRLALRGRIGFAGERRVRLAGTLERFAPGLLVAGVDAQVSGDLSLDARLAPLPEGALQFTLRDSRAFGRPLAGQGELRLDAQRRLDVDLALALRSARLVARGGLGGEGRALDLTLDAPALDEWVPGLAGGVALQARARGDWRAPAIEAHAAAKALRWGEHRLREAAIDLSAAGGADGVVHARATLSGHRFGDRSAWSIAEAEFTGDGPLAAHALALRATTAQGRQLRIAADGAFAERRWSGRLREAGLDGALPLRLAAAAPLQLAADGFELGPLALEAGGARFEDLRLGMSGDTLRSEGRFADLAPQAFAHAWFGDAQPAGLNGDTLRLAGRWQVALGAQADGRLRIERTGGDLNAGSPDGELRLRELRLDATLEANRLAARAQAASERGSALDARLAAFVEHDARAGWRLAPQRPWQADADAEVESLARLQSLVAEFIGHAWRVDGRIGAHLHVGGTPARMSAGGTISGERLRLAWIEEGLRLEDGTLRAHLADDALVLDELRFAAAPRGRPRDARVAARLEDVGAGSLVASGRLDLREGGGAIELRAQRLPLSQRPDRWLVASGEARLAATRESARLEGEIGVDFGDAEAVRATVPALSADVVVRRRDAPAPPRAPRYPMAIDLGLNLGPSFYVKAAGLDARAEGTLRLRGGARADALSVTGTVAAIDGRYEGFGQRLAIRRARLNFQGAPENPGLDVLAVREGLPVEVGVTVTRNLAQPLVRLWADPPMADPEVLSWLLLGHAGEQTSTDNLALLQATLGALGGSDAGIAGRLARSLGVDEFALRSGEMRGTGSLLPPTAVAGDLRGDRSSTTGLATGVVSLGKRIGDAITISYEQALAGTDRFVQLSYRLSQRLSLVARAGTENAFELVYGWVFD